METDEHVSKGAMPLTKERWYSRAGKWTAGALKKTGGVLRSMVKPTLFAVALGATCYGGFESGRAYQSWEDGSLLEHTIMQETEKRSIVRQGNKLYIHESKTKTEAVDIDMIYEMMRKGGAGTIDYQ